MTTRARDFKFAGAIVQRLYLVMVVLTQKFFSAHYAWFPRGGSHILAHISMSIRARDFKFAGAIVQRLYLVMVALTKNRLSAQYGWFCHGRSHIIIQVYIRP